MQLSIRRLHAFTLLVSLLTFGFVMTQRATAYRRHAGNYAMLEREALDDFKEFEHRYRITKHIEETRQSSVPRILMDPSSDWADCAERGRQEAQLAGHWKAEYARLSKFPWLYPRFLFPQAKHRRSDFAKASLLRAIHERRKASRQKDCTCPERSSSAQGVETGRCAAHFESIGDHRPAEVESPRTIP